MKGCPDLQSYSSFEQTADWSSEGSVKMNDDIYDLKVKHALSMSVISLYLEREWEHSYMSVICER